VAKTSKNNLIMNFVRETNVLRENKFNSNQILFVLCLKCTLVGCWLRAGYFWKEDDWTNAPCFQAIYFWAIRVLETVMGKEETNSQTTQISF